MDIVNKEISTGINSNNMKNRAEKCEACELVKAKRHPFKTRDYTHRATLPGGVLHVILCGPMQAMRIQGSGYSMPVIEECSRFVKVYFMTKKSDAADLLLSCIE